MCGAFVFGVTRGLWTAGWRSWRAPWAGTASTTGPAGDFILLDGYNGASRNPYHALAILDLQLASLPLLGGYGNQLVVRVDGLMEPRIAMDAALRRCDVLGRSVFAVAEVPKAAFRNLRRL